MTLGDRLAAFAAARFGTMKALAETAGLDQVQMSRYVKGKNTPGAEVLMKLAALELSIDWLLTGRGDMLAAPEAPSSPIVGEPMSPEGWNTTESYAGPADMASIGLQRILALHERQTEEMRRAIAEELARG